MYHHYSLNRHDTVRVEGNLPRDANRENVSEVRRFESDPWRVVVVFLGHGHVNMEIVHENTS
jgi:hypothetical protein